MVTVIYSWSLSNYLREGKDEGFDWFGLNRFGGEPEGGPGGPIDARGRFFGAWLLGIAGRTDFFGMRIWGFGFCLMLLEFAISFASRFRFTSFFFGIKISSYSESSSSESSSLNTCRSDGGSLFHWESGKTFVISKDPFFPHTYLNPKNTMSEKSWSFTIPKYNLTLFAAVTFRDETKSMPNICKIPL